MSRPQPSPEEQKRQRIRAVGKYGGLVFFLFGAILAGVLIGKWLDERVANQRPFFAVSLAVLFLAGALWQVFRQLLNDK